MQALIGKLKARRQPGGGADGEESSGIELLPMDLRIERRLVTPWRVAALAGAVLFAGSIAWAWFSFALNPAQSVSTLQLAMAEARRDVFRDFIPVTGNVVPRNTVYLDTIEGGQVTEVFVEEGLLVDAGQPLVALKNTDLQLGVINSEAQLTEQLNNLSMTQLSFEQNRLRNSRDVISVSHLIGQLERQLQRYRQLSTTGAVTRRELEDIEAEYLYQKELRDAVVESRKVDEEFQLKQVQQLQAATESMNRNIAIARENLDNLLLKAPVSGHLTMLEAELGQSISRGQRIGQIDATDAFKVSAQVDEFYLSRVTIGKTATTEIDGQEYRLDVDKVYTEVRNRQFQVDLVFVQQSPATIRRGQTLRMNLDIGDQTEALVVPNGPFYDDTGGAWVFVVAADARTAVRRDIKLGRRNPTHIEVLGGLSPGDRIVTSSYGGFDNVDRLMLTP